MPLLVLLRSLLINPKKTNKQKDKNEVLLHKFCNFALRNLYLQYSIEEVESATTRILEAWMLNKENIDNEGYVIDSTKVNPGSFSNLAIKDEAVSNPLEELIDTSDELPPRPVQYDVDDFE